MTAAEEKELREANQRLADKITEQRKLFAEVYTGMLVAGWHEDELVRRVKAAR